MNELKLKYDNVKTWRIQNEIKNDMSKIKIAHNNGVNDWYVKREYGMTVGEMWKTLSLAEKQQVEKWVKKYEEKLIQAVKEYTCIETTLRYIADDDSAREEAAKRLERIFG